MKSKKLKTLLFACCLVLLLLPMGFKKAADAHAYHIPPLRFDPWKEMGALGKTEEIETDSLEISKLVTLGEYREYLSAIEKDSSPQFYRSQLPDSSMCLAGTYAQYVNTNAFDAFPASGISWDNAMSFCKWKTIRENPGDSFRVVYRLPELSEWLAAFHYLQVKKIKNDFNQLYSDWTMAAKDEAVYAYGESNFRLLDYEYWPAPGESRALKRKVVIGNSFHFARPVLFDFLQYSYYENEGYAHIGFRYVCEKTGPVKKYSAVSPEFLSTGDNCLLHWGLLVSKPK